MAQRTVVLLEDDIDGGEAAETIAFGFDGTTYEIDLNENNAAHMRDTFAPFVGAARRSGRSTNGTRASRPAPQRTRGNNDTQPPTDVDTKAVRAWAEANDVKVSTRGRVSAAVLEQYRAATGS